MDNTEFIGFSEQSFEWFRGLEADNSREYFKRTREIYESQVRGPLTSLLNVLIGEFPGFAHVFRQNRDVRFSSNKEPYKLKTYGVVAEIPNSFGAYYAEVSSKGLFAGGGYHQMASDQLTRFRKTIDSDDTGAAFAGLVEEIRNDGLELFGRSLASVPKGYRRDHVRREFLAMKEVLAGRRLTPLEAIRRDSVLEIAFSTWRTTRTLNEWLDRHVGASEIPPEARWGR